MSKLTWFLLFAFRLLWHPSHGNDWNWTKPSGWSDKYSEMASKFQSYFNKDCYASWGSSRSKTPDLSGAYTECKEKLEEASHKKHPLIGKNTKEIIEFYGYNCESHKVTTKDGYILTLFRIPSNGTSVILWHGLGSSSDCWVFNGPTQSFAFVLADQGFDVWLGNSRGSSYSLGHKKLSSANLDYWDFSWHENGMFDLPASIKHMRKKNGDKPIFYVGHSQGTTNFMVGASTKPASDVLNKDNVISAFFLAASAFLGRSGGSPTRLVIPLLADPTIGNIVRTALGGRIESRRKLEELSGVYLGNVCSPEAIFCGVCSALFLAQSGFNAPLANYSNIPHLLDKNSNNIPVKSLIHYAQSVDSCKFRQFNYGNVKNKELYGSEAPPDYELKNIKVPTYFYWGAGDNTCTPQDINRTKSAFRKKVVKGFTRVDHDTFNHVDFVIANRVKELLYDQIIDEMKKLETK